MAFQRWSRSAAWALGLLASPVIAVTVGQVDTFQNGGTGDWVTGGPSPNPPANGGGGGPGGASDLYLLATATGLAAPGGKLVLFNSVQWTGSYTGAALSAITMDLKNFGSTELDLHLQVTGPDPSVFAYTTAAFVVPAASGWMHATFSLLPAALTGTFTVLSGVNELRLWHGNLGPSNVSAQLGIDNISAVPEPDRALMLAGGLAVLIGLWRRRSAR